MMFSLVVEKNAERSLFSSPMIKHVEILKIISSFIISRLSLVINHYEMKPDPARISGFNFLWFYVPRNSVHNTLLRRPFQQ